MARLRSELAQAQEANKAGEAQLQAVLVSSPGRRLFERVLHRGFRVLRLHLGGPVLSLFRGLTRLESSSKKV